MTDITELAQRLKAAATNVKETAHIARYLKATIARQTFKELMTPDNILTLVEALEKAQQRIAELEREQEQLRPVGVMSEKAFHRLENSECRFIALWPRPGIFLPRKRPEDGVIVYALTVAAAGIKVEAE
ncbi:hypothetical protein ACKLK7_11310 [Klebsiella quasipneumoniae subsp. similipneumoniae]|uniref:hypothetical protein n=1 Tax=Klebsiella quasipneumoniae TaxID=1463165 RepID=UPI000B41D6E5|nr:hypothetical protein [Klebsiella quasipneumoniae]AZJ03776.1 hypothetical protein BME54_07695 [Klebsiella quasipneumoniae]MDH2693423.1 hypothetical protein [Klebsiella quasipneumoniae]OVW11081.1 hypothetical protein BME61_05435 [Klebsiella quasipneumoniae subsp. similipneumoniae]OVW15579.1 hypothetical protein BME56_29750 [Klebsiella quasipneumoniae subsp. similipneumoniae]OVW24058.1 hypothetical protein BME58_04080 [Klebsiella quasipneumoniae subsp. similipneumoniae]